MTIHIPRSIVFLGGVAFTVALVGMMMKQAPEMLRYLKIEGM